MSPPFEQGNTAAAKPPEQVKGKTLTVRVRRDLGRRVRECHERRNMTQTTWLIEAIEAQCREDEAGLHSIEPATNKEKTR
jgi:hypothetical protein